MLTIHYGDMDGVVYNTSVYFDNVYSPKWFEDPFAQKVIKTVDRDVVLGPNAIETKILGVIPPPRSYQAEPKRSSLCISCQSAFTTPRTAATTARDGY